MTIKISKLKRRRARIFKQQEGRCLCGKLLKFKDATIEHLVPKCKGGTNEAGNLVVCCQFLNSKLAAKSAAEKILIVANLKRCNKT